MITNVQEVTVLFALLILDSTENYLINVVDVCSWSTLVPLKANEFITTLLIVNNTDVILYLLSLKAIFVAQDGASSWSAFCTTEMKKSDMKNPCDVEQF